ncbi:MAG: hypothetical protein NE327_20590 [Lentisphaeraceae bacterium]|nr:hypothetical protein [Lentisphaeraceae bacterium]
MSKVVLILLMFSSSLLPIGKYDADLLKDLDEKPNGNDFLIRILIEPSFTSPWLIKMKGEKSLELEIKGLRRIEKTGGFEISFKKIFKISDRESEILRNNFKKLRVIDPASLQTELFQHLDGTSYLFQYNNGKTIKTFRRHEADFADMPEEILLKFSKEERFRQDIIDYRKEKKILKPLMNKIFTLIGQKTNKN